MKNIILIGLLLASTLAYSQTSFIKYNEEDILINGVTTTVANSQLKGDIKQIKKSWLKFVKVNLDQKMSEKDDVLSATEVVINQITDKRGDLLVYIYNKDNDVLLNVAYKLGYDVFLNSEKYPEEFKKLQSYLEYFTYNYYNDYLPSYIKNKKKSLKVLTKENRKAEKNVKKSNKCISKFDRKNAKYTKRINKLIEKGDTASEKLVKYKAKIADYDKKKEYYQELLKVSSEIITTLSPKIEATKEEINSANLTLIEVRSKVKSFTK